MTVEDLHDALTLLPADLVAEADKRRSRKPRLVLWHRWAAMAACVVLIAGCGLLYWQGRMEKATYTMQAPAAYDAEAAPAEAAPKEAVQAAPSQEEALEDQNLQDSAVTAGTGRMIQSNGMDTGTFAPGILDITRVETPMEDASSASVSGEPRVTLICSAETLEDYLAGCVSQTVEALEESTEAFDESWFSTHDLLMLRLVCSADAAVTDIQEKDGRWEIYVEENSPESPAGDYHILITVEKGLIGSADDVTPFYAIP